MCVVVLDSTAYGPTLNEPMIIDVHSHAWNSPAHFSEDFRSQAKKSYKAAGYPRIEGNRWRRWLVLLFLVGGSLAGAMAFWSSDKNGIALPPQIEPVRVFEDEEKMVKKTPREKSSVSSGSTTGFIQYSRNLALKH